MNTPQPGHIPQHRPTTASPETQPVPEGAGVFEHTVTAPAGTQGCLRDTFHSTLPLVFGPKVCFSPSHQQPLRAQLREGAGARLQLEQLPALCIPQGQNRRSTGSRSPACTAWAHPSSAIQSHSFLQLSRTISIASSEFT